MNKQVFWFLLLYKINIQNLTVQRSSTPHTTGTDIKIEDVDIFNSLIL